jgi:hypothetical protein
MGAHTAADDFWNSWTKGLLSELCQMVGTGAGTKLFWSQQQIKDRTRFAQGVPPVVIEERHAIALEWNELIHTGEIVEALWYEKKVRQDPMSEWWHDEFALVLGK